jgi:hypothetical protein
MALNRRLCFTAQEPWVMMDQQMMVRLSTSLRAKFGAILAARAWFVKSKSSIENGTVIPESLPVWSKTIKILQKGR